MKIVILTNINKKILLHNTKVKKKKIAQICQESEVFSNSRNWYYKSTKKKLSFFKVFY